MIKLRILRDYPGLSEQAQCNHSSPYKIEAGRLESERKCKDGSRVREEKRCYASGFEDRGRSHESIKCKWSPEIGKCKETDFPLEASVETSPADTLTLVP